MSAQLKPLRDQVMVITGASSGIGLATAKLAASEGARVLLAARGEEALSRAVQEIAVEGGEAAYVVADVCDTNDLVKTAETAVRYFGRIDTWVNNAGVGLFGLIEQVSEEDHRRLFETNFWGLVNGSLVALQHLREHGGAIINIGSVASDVSLPNLTMSSASKHAVKGFTDGLRTELESEGAPISVTLVKPASIDTPFPQHARNYMSVEPKLPPPIYSVTEVARSVCHAAAHPQRDIYIGGGGRMMGALRYYVPRLVDRASAKMALQQMRSDTPPRRPEGILQQPSNLGEEHGDMHGRAVHKVSVYNRAIRNPGLTGGVALTLGLVAAAALAHQQQRQ